MQRGGCDADPFGVVTAIIVMGLLVAWPLWFSLRALRADWADPCPPLPVVGCPARAAGTAVPGGGLDDYVRDGLLALQVHLRQELRRTGQPGGPAAEPVPRHAGPVPPRSAGSGTVPAGRSLTPSDTNGSASPC